MIAPLLEHKFGEAEDQMNVARIANLCAEDSGLWRTTTTMNLEKLERFAESHPELDQDQKARLKASVATLRQP